MITKWTHQGDVRSERQIWQLNAAKQKKPKALKKAFNKREWIFCEPMAVVFGNTKRRRTPDRLIADIDLNCCVLVILPPGWAAQSTHIPKKKRGGGGINAMSMRNARTYLLRVAMRSHQHFERGRAYGAGGGKHGQYTPLVRVHGEQKKFRITQGKPREIFTSY